MADSGGSGDVVGTSVLEVGADGTGFETALGRMKKTAEGFEAAAVTSAGKASGALENVGQGAVRGAAATDRATRQLQASIERTIAAFQGGERGSTRFFESLAKQRGANLEVLRPYIDQLEAAKSAQDEVARSLAAKTAQERAAAAAAAEAARAQQQAQAATAAYLAGLREEIALLGMSGQARRAYQAAKANQAAGGGSEGAALLAILERQRQAQAAAAQVAREEAEAQRQAAAAKKSAEAAAAAFINQLREQVALQGKSQADVLRYRAAQLGIATDAEKYIRSIEAAAATTGRLGVSVGQTTAAMRQLPAQFTDIATSLAGGQNPLLVLIQQGGQIKDSFGGIGPALRAVAAAVSPTALAFGSLAAVLGLVAYGFAEGQDEAHAYSRALILSGNAAGTSADKLGGYAKTLDATVGTQAKAAETLAALAATGQVAGSVMLKAAEAAIRLEREGGPAVDKTVQAFAELGKAPLQASIKLNESTGFLTVSLYTQIRALEQQGRTAEAAALAQNAYADEGIRRGKLLEAQLGTFPRLWRDIASSIKEARDALLDFGRPDTLEEKIDRAEKALARLNAAPRRGGTRAEVVAAGGADPVRVELTAQIDSMKEAQRLQDRIAEYEKLIQAGTKARIEFDRVGDSFASPTEALQKQIAPIRQWGEAMKAAGHDAAQVDAEVQQLVGRISAASQAVGLLNATAEARSAGEAERRSLAVQEQMRVLRVQREQGLITEVQLIGQLAEREKDLLRIERERVEAQLRTTPATPQNAPRVAGLREELRTIAYRITLVDAQQGDDVRAALERIQQAAAASLVAVANHATKLDEAEAAKTAQMRQQLVALRDRNDQLSMGEAAYAAHTVATMRAEAADLDWQAAMQGGNFQLEERARILRGMAAASEQANLLAGSRAAAEANAEAARRAADDWQRTADDIRSGLTDAFRRAFESGEDFGTAFAKTIGREIQARIAAAFAGLLADSALQLGGLALTAAASRTGGNGASDWLRGASTARDAYSLASGSYAAAGNYAAVYSGQAYGTGFATQQSAMLAAQEAGMVSQAGAGTMSSWGAYAGWAALIALGVSKAMDDWGDGYRRDQARDVSQTFWGGFGMLGDLQPMGGLEASKANLLSQLGFSDKWADLLSGATAVAKLFGRSAPRVDAQGVSGSIAGGDFTGQMFADIVEKGGLFRSDKRYTQLGDLPDELGRFLDQGARQVFDQAAKFGDALGLPGQQLGQVTSDLRIEFSKPENDTKEAIAEATKKNIEAIAEALGEYGDDLVQSWAEAVAPVAQYGETTAQTIERVGGALVNVNGALQQIGIEEFAKSIAGAQDALDLAGRFGGTDQLGAAAGAFAEAFTSDSEQVALLTARLGTEFAALGLQMPDLGDSADRARAQFLDLVRAQDLNTEAGQKAFAALLGLSEAFDTAADRAESLQRDLNRAIAGAIEAYSPEDRTRSQYGRVAADLADVDVTVSVDQLMGASRDEIAAFAQAFVGLTSNSIEARTAVATAAEALFGLKDAADDAKKAAADEQAAIDRRRDSLEIDLLRAQGRELEAVNRERQAELAALRDLDPALARIKESTYAAVDAARVLAGLDGVIGDFASGADLNNFRAWRIQQTLAGGGIDVPIERIMGATTDDIVDLWHAVGDAGKQAILDSYSALTQLQTDLTTEQRKGLEDQLAGMKGLRDLAKDIAQFTASLKFSDLSPLSAEAQLAQAQALFETTLTKAREGDVAAQGALLGNAQAYLDELSAAFASGPNFTREFDRVTAVLDQLGLDGAALDPQIKVLEEIAANDRRMLDALLSIDGTLRGGLAPVADVGGPNPGPGPRYELPDASESGTWQVSAASVRTIELLQRQVDQITTVVAELKAQSGTLGALATISQVAARDNKAGLEAVRKPLQDIADQGRLRRD